jgi:hypothetical protein
VIAEANEDTIRGIGLLPPEPTGVSEEILLPYYGPPAAPYAEQLPSIVTLTIL